MRTLIASIDSDIGAGIHRLLPDADTTGRFSKGTFFLDVTDPPWTFKGRSYDRVFYTIAADKPTSEFEVMSINAIAAYKFFDTLANNDTLAENCRVVILSSQVGSIAEINGDNLPYYRMSKAALNMGIAILNKRYPKIRWMLLHPGAVKTKMTLGRIYPNNTMIDVDTSAKLIVERSLDPVPFGFYGLTGRVIPW